MVETLVVDWRTVRGPSHAETPVWSLAASATGVLAGGLTGVVVVAEGRRLDPGVGPVTALAAAGDWIFAGGAGGVARSGDGGTTWTAATAPLGGAPVSCLLPMPGFDSHGIVLAGTVGAGVLRSDDRGRSFTPAGFGLPSREVTAMCELPDGAVLAATAAGVCRSRGAGRAWQVCPGPAGAVVAAVAAATDGIAYAATDDGTIWRAPAGDLTFEPWRRVPGEPGAMIVTGGSVLVAGSEGVVALDAAGVRRVTTTPALALLSLSGEVVLGAPCGYGRADRPPAVVPGLADVDRLVASAALWWVSRYSGAWRLGPDGWAHVRLPAVPTLDAVVDEAGALVTAGPHGVVRSRDDGPEVLLAASVARVARRGETIVAAGPGGGLWRSDDAGAEWSRRAAPFGVRAPSALHCASRTEVWAVAHDDVRAQSTLWQSGDGGMSWARSGVHAYAGDAFAFLGDPGVALLGRRVHRRSPSGGWECAAELADVPRRATVAPDGRVVAVTPVGVEVVVGADSRPLPLPTHVADPAAVVDVAVGGASLFLLDRAGQVSRAPF
ncbi:WD40/YVTN/BNR-like repeat-containing protein [Micromonospora sp. NPDC051300]|uniref:WD40/YVTN/BNR-like repeat-containing protein n=1 Tax=Micromonospora sp. NPDC051300 TaxID=3364286 RepID=UPI0037ADFAD0